MSSSASITSDIKALEASSEIENVEPYKTCTITGDGNEFVVIGDQIGRESCRERV